MIYNEITVKIRGGKNEGKYLNLNISHIQYYREFFDLDGKTIDTMIYLMGNPNGIRIDCTPDWLSRKIKTSIDLSMLGDQDREKVISFIGDLIKEKELLVG